MTTDAIIAFLGGLLGIALLAAPLNAWLLRICARRMEHFDISLSQGYFVAVKAGVVAYLVSCIVVLVAASISITQAKALDNIGWLTYLLVWWWRHSNELLRIAPTNVELSQSHAKALSARVFAYAFALTLLLSLVILGVSVLVQNF